jgi:hypothetical protein
VIKRINHRAVDSTTLASVEIASAGLLVGHMLDGNNLVQLGQIVRDQADVLPALVVALLDYKPSVVRTVLRFVPAVLAVTIEQVALHQTD